jgi:glycogen synthase
MKVLMTADAVGGVFTYAVELGRALRDLDVEVVIATMGPPPRPAQREALAAAGIAVRIGPYRLEWMEEPWADVHAAGEWLLGLEQEMQPDIIHLNGYAHGALTWAAPVLVVGHSCVLSWWRAVHGCDAPPQWARYRDAVASGLHAADLVVTPTRAMLDALQEHYGRMRRARVIANGSGDGVLPLGARDAFDRYPRSRTLRQPAVLAAGRVWDEAKDMATLAAAAEHIRWPVYIAGADRHPSGGRTLLDGVRQLGALEPEALHRWYRRASILVHPSLYEPFGLAPLEAAQAGAALVLADIPSLREVWRGAATYVPPRDATALAAAVNALADQPLLLADRAAAAGARARTLTAGTMARGYHAAYGALVRGRRSAAADAAAARDAAAAQDAAAMKDAAAEQATCAS